MKKLVVASLCLICSIFTVQAQNTVIIKEGLHFSNQISTTSEASVAYDYIMDCSSSAAYRAQLGKGFAFQPEFSLLSKGSSFESNGSVQKTSILYIEMPILLVYQPVNTEKFSVGLFGGPSLGLGLLGCLELDGEEIDMDWGDNGFKRTEFSWTFGADFQFKMGAGKAVIDLRYLSGQSDIGGTTATKSSQGELTNNGFGFSLGYAYPINF